MCCCTFHCKPCHAASPKQIHAHPRRSCKLCCQRAGGPCINHTRSHCLLKLARCMSYNPVITKPFSIGTTCTVLLASNDHSQAQNSKSSSLFWAGHQQPKQQQSQQGRSPKQHSRPRYPASFSCVPVVVHFCSVVQQWHLTVLVTTVHHLQGDPSQYAPLGSCGAAVVSTLTR
jgi:hypothetical protein